MEKVEIALEKFNQGYNCAQSVIYAYSEKLNLPKDLILKVSNGFGGGMGRTQEVCGAISGGIMVLSLLYGRGENDDKTKQDYNYTKVRELISKFQNKFDSVHCKTLLDGCEILTAEGQNKFRSEGLVLRCNSYISQTIEILEEIID